MIFCVVSEKTCHVRHVDGGLGGVIEGLMCVPVALFSIEMSVLLSNKFSI